MQISKQEAASRQLDVAIRLFFRRCNVLAVFTLANAASVILCDLVQTRNPNQDWNQIGAEANGMPLSDWFKALRRTPNFLKHARNDPDAYEEIGEADVDHILFIACLNHGALLTVAQHPSTPQSIFQLWTWLDIQRICRAPAAWSYVRQQQQARRLTNSGCAVQGWTG